MLRFLGCSKFSTAHASALLAASLMTVASPFTAPTSSGNLVAAESSGYFFNPRLSSRDIALNESVRLTFSTMPVQVVGVDVEQAVLRSLQSRSDGRDWRLLNAPLITIHEKGKDVEITLELLPRRSGEITLPSIDLPWLEGNHRTNFGTINVANRVDTAPQDSEAAPSEIDGISGFRWGEEIAAIAKRLGQTVEPGAKELSLGEQLHLEFPAGTLAKAQLRTNGLTLRDARAQLVQRWGTPVRTKLDNPMTFEWSLGWVWISAAQHDSAAGGDLVVTITNEKIAQDAAAIFLRQQLFAPLDQDRAVNKNMPAKETSAPEQQPTVANPANAAAAVPAEETTPAGISDDDIQAELERNLQAASDTRN